MIVVCLKAGVTVTPIVIVAVVIGDQSPSFPSRLIPLTSKHSARGDSIRQVLPGVLPPFSGLPSGDSEVLQCGSVRSINRGVLTIFCMKLLS